MCGQQTEATFVDLVSSAPNPFPECTVELEYPYGERMWNYAQVTGQISLFTDSNLRRPIPSPSENPYRWSPKLQRRQSPSPPARGRFHPRSEERRVGKECRSRWSPCRQK